MAAGGTAARTVLVIGAHGALGGALVRAFEDAGWRAVRGVRRGDGARGCTVVDVDRSETVAAASLALTWSLIPCPIPAGPQSMWCCARAAR
jgi:NAD(P)-dependent dehydrogenase (short-subunit alcohol dehydrogenase family)